MHDSHNIIIRGWREKTMIIDFGKNKRAKNRWEYCRSHDHELFFGKAWDLPYSKLVYVACNQCGAHIVYDRNDDMGFFSPFNDAYNKFKRNIEG